MTYYEMGDFLLDLREPDTRRQGALQAASLLKFTEDTQAKIIDRSAFSLVLARVDGFELWGPCEWRSGDENILIALAGRIALEEHEWEEARKAVGTGGLACKANLQKYPFGGVEFLPTLNGYIAVFVHHTGSVKLELITPCCGMFPAYSAPP